MNNTNIIKSSEIENILKKIINMAKEVGKDMNPNYKRKLVYSLLNSIKAHDQEEFLWILLRALNDPKNENFLNLAKKIECIHNINPQIFEKWGYAVVLGIMSSSNVSEVE